MSNNKKLYKINVQHVAPKDEHTSLECFLLAENDEAVYFWLDKEKRYGGWEDINDDGNEYKIYDNTDDYNVIGTETFKEKMIRIKGELNDEDRCFADAYYGLTFYGWELVEENPSPVLISSLFKMKVLFETNSVKNIESDKTIVDVDEVIAHCEMRRNWNRPELEDLVFYKNGIKMEISDEDIRQWKFYGLNNTDFVASRDWEENRML
jgi:hypothetical protein